jgi:hypothetical protein
VGGAGAERTNSDQVVFSESVSEGRRHGEWVYTQRSIDVVFRFGFVRLSS